MKKLLLDGQTLQTPDRQRGIGRYLLSMLQAMIGGDDGLQIICCTTADLGHWRPSDGLQTGVCWRRLELGNEGIPLPQQELLYRNAIEDLVAAEAIDAYWNPNPLMPNVLFPGLVRGCANIAAVHDVIPLVMLDPYLVNAPADRFEDYIARLLALARYHAILAPSQCTRRDLIDHTNIAPEAIHVIADGVADPFFDRLSQENLSEIRLRYGLRDSVIFSLVGADFRKNTQRLLDAFGLLADQGDMETQLVIGGGFDAVERQRLALWLEERGLTSRVLFTGTVPDEDLAGLYQLSRLFVFPSLYEGFGLPVIEAMASGTPVAAAGGSSLKEVGGSAAAYFDPTDHTAIAEVIARLLASAERSSQMVIAGRQRAEGFRWTQTAAATLQTLRQACVRRRPAETEALPAAGSQRPPAASKKPRWAFFSPLSPQRSGIADYCEELLPHMAAHAEIDIFVDGIQPSTPHISGAFACHPYQTFEERNTRSPYRSVIYHMGNNAIHEYIYETLLSHAGITVLHDYNLHSFIHAITCNNGYARDHASAPYLQQIEACYAKLGRVLSQRLAVTPLPPGELWRLHGRFAMNQRVVDASRALIVHSQWVRDQIDSQDVHVVPHGVTPPLPISETDLLALRRANGIEKDAFLLACFGDVTSTKRIRSVMRAFSIFRLFHPNSRLWFVGGCQTGMQAEIEKLSRRYRLDTRLGLAGRVSADIFMAFMQTADVVLNLRFPTQGETSGSLLKAMACGKPVIVSDVNQFRELPDECVLKTTLGRREQDTLVTHLLRLKNDDDYRQRIGRRARDYVRRTCAWDRVVAAYVEIAERYAA